MKDLKGSDFFRAILDAMPSPVLIVDSEMRIRMHNEAAAPFLGRNANLLLQLKTGTAIHCLHSADTQAGCGFGEDCKSCVVRNSVRESLNDTKVVRRGSRMTLMGKDGNRDFHLLVTAAPLHYDGETYAVLTLEDIGDIIELRKLIPICASCKRIRNEKEYWDTVEAYFEKQMDLEFTHGICPDCVRRLYPDLGRKLAATGE